MLNSSPRGFPARSLPKAANQSHAKNPVAKTQRRCTIANKEELSPSFSKTSPSNTESMLNAAVNSNPSTTARSALTSFCVFLASIVALRDSEWSKCESTAVSQFSHA